MEKISCNIARDLLPLYVEGILSEETAQVVEMHLQTCKSCKKDFETMRQEFVFPSAPKIQEENERILKEYIDYECINYMDEWNFENWGIKYWSKTTEFIDYMEQH